MTTRVCFVALNAYPVIAPEIPGPIGGIETRSWMLARGLALQPEMKVDFVVRHPRRLRSRHVQGVELHLWRDRLYSYRESLSLRLQRSSSFPWLKLKEPRVSDALTLPAIAVQRLLRGNSDPFRPLPVCDEIPADLFLTFGVQRNSAGVIAAARERGVPAVLVLGSDSDLDDRYLTDQNFVSNYRDSTGVCRWIIQNADRILCQTESQLEKLKQFERGGTLLRNPIDFSEWGTSRIRPLASEFTGGLKRYVLWVGRAESVHKQPMQLIQLARRCPEVDFLMILNRRDDGVEAEVRNSAPANVRIVEKVPFSHMPALMEHSVGLVNTSSLEGFPNTFLQAAASGIPVASLNVESQFLRESWAGICAEGDLLKLENAIRAIWNGKASRFFDAEQARQLIESRYSLTAISRQLAEFVKETKRGNCDKP